MGSVLIIDGGYVEVIIEKINSFMGRVECPRKDEFRNV